MTSWLDRARRRTKERIRRSLHEIDPSNSLRPDSPTFPIYSPTATHVGSKSATSSPKCAPHSTVPASAHTLVIPPSSPALPTATPHHSSSSSQGFFAQAAAPGSPQCVSVPTTQAVSPERGARAGALRHSVSAGALHSQGLGHSVVSLDRSMAAIHSEESVQRTTTQTPPSLPPAPASPVYLSPPAARGWASPPTRAVSDTGMVYGSEGQARRASMRELRGARGEGGSRGLATVDRNPFRHRRTLSSIAFDRLVNRRSVSVDACANQNINAPDTPLQDLLPQLIKDGNVAGDDAYMQRLQGFVRDSLFTIQDQVFALATEDDTETRLWGKEKRSPEALLCALKTWDTRLRSLDTSLRQLRMPTDATQPPSPPVQPQQTPEQAETPAIPPDVISSYESRILDLEAQLRRKESEVAALRSLLRASP